MKELQILMPRGKNNGTKESSLSSSPPLKFLLLLYVQNSSKFSVLCTFSISLLFHTWILFLWCTTSLFSFNIGFWAWISQFKWTQWKFWARSNILAIVTKTSPTPLRIGLKNMAITSGFATIQKQKMGILDLANQGRSKNPFFPLRSLHISSSGLTFRGF